MNDEKLENKDWQCLTCSHMNSSTNEVCMGAEMGDGRCGCRKHKFNYKVHLTYFKGHGKYYSDGEYTSHKEQLFEITDEAQDMARTGKVPGMVDVYKPKFMLINVPGHPHDHPRLYVQDINEERSEAFRRLRKLTAETLVDILDRLDEEIVD